MRETAATSHYDAVPPDVSLVASAVPSFPSGRRPSAPSTTLASSTGPPLSPARGAAASGVSGLPRGVSTPDEKTLRKLCESCRERKAVKRAALSDGSMLKLCESCLSEITAPKSPVIGAPPADPSTPAGFNAAARRGTTPNAAATDLGASPPPPSGFNPNRRATAATGSAKLTTDAAASASFHTPVASPTPVAPVSVTPAGAAIAKAGKRYTPPPVADPNAAAGVGSTAYVAKYPFKATAKGQLSFGKGEVFKIYSQDKPEWWKALSGAGIKGWVPAKYLQPASAQQAADFDAALKTALRTGTSSRILESPSAADAPHAQNGLASPRQPLSPLGAERESDIIDVEGLVDDTPVRAQPSANGPRRPPTPQDDEHGDLPPPPGEDSGGGGGDDDDDDGDAPQPPSESDDVDVDADNSAADEVEALSSENTPREPPRGQSTSPSIDVAVAAAEKRAAEVAVAAERRAAELAAAADRSLAQARVEAAEQRAQQLAREADAALERERLAAQRAREEAQAEKERAEKAEALLRERERALEERERTLLRERAEAERLAGEAQREAQARAEAERKAAEAAEHAKEAERLAREAAREAEAKKKNSKRTEKDSIKRSGKSKGSSSSSRTHSESKNPLRAFAALRMSLNDAAVEEARACAKRSGASSGPRTPASGSTFLTRR
jgi:hypothetical protein